MKTKNKPPILKALAYTSLLLCLGGSCKKELVLEDPLAGFRCNDGTCCGQGKSEYKYIKTIENEPADYAAAAFYPAFNLKDPIVTSSGNVYIISICELSNIQSMNLTNTYFMNKTPTYQYRIWGKVYDNLSATSIGPPYHALYIYIEKVEKTN
jgi:hypothetical protein